MASGKKLGLFLQSKRHFSSSTECRKRLLKITGMYTKNRDVFIIGRAPKSPLIEVTLPVHERLAAWEEATAHRSSLDCIL